MKILNYRYQFDRYLASILMHSQVSTKFQMGSQFVNV